MGFRFLFRRVAFLLAACRRSRGGSLAGMAPSFVSVTNSGAMPLMGRLRLTPGPLQAGDCTIPPVAGLVSCLV